MVVSKTIPKYKLYPFSDQKGPKTIRFRAANICLTRAWLCRFKVLFGSQYRARSPLSGVSVKLECNPKLLNDSTSCNQIWGNIDIAQMHRSFNVYVMDGRKQKSDFNCAAPPAQAGKSRSHVFSLVKNLSPALPRLGCFCSLRVLKFSVIRRQLLVSLQRTPRRGPRFNLVPGAIPWEMGSGSRKCFALVLLFDSLYR